MSSNTKSFDDCIKTTNEMENFMRETEKEVNTVEAEEIKEMLNKYDIILKGDVDEKNVISKYEIEKNNADQVIKCFNRVLERIKELETNVYNNKMKELDDMELQKYNDSKQQLKEIQTNNQKLNVGKSLRALKHWFCLKTLNIIFDSDIDGDGSGNVLFNKVFGRRNLYFLTFDDNDNIFGGFVREYIDKFNYYLYGDDAFVFSLIKNGHQNNAQYRIGDEYKNDAFILRSNVSKTDALYAFGYEIYVYSIGNPESEIFCEEFGDEVSRYTKLAYGCRFDFNEKQSPIIASTNANPFAIQRIIIIQME
ncbi:TLDc domain-containing protein [Entamoeba marina]